MPVHFLSSHVDLLAPHFYFWQLITSKILKGKAVKTIIPVKKKCLTSLYTSANIVSLAFCLWTITGWESCHDHLIQSENLTEGSF